MQGQGECQLINDAIFPEKMCFCTEGWFGQQCERENSFPESGSSHSGWLETNFQHERLGQHRLLWRVDNGDSNNQPEVEIIAEMNTLSWVGVGWRPADATKSCQNFPTDAPAPRGRDFNPMDCTDMVIGVARGNKGQLADYYTRDRSTPQRDSFWVSLLEILLFNCHRNLHFLLLQRLTIDK